MDNSLALLYLLFPILHFFAAISLFNLWKSQTSFKSTKKPNFLVLSIFHAFVACFFTSIFIWAMMMSGIALGGGSLGGSQNLLEFYFFLFSEGIFLGLTVFTLRILLIRFSFYMAVIQPSDNSQAQLWSISFALMFIQILTDILTDIIARILGEHLYYLFYY